MQMSLPNAGSSWVALVLSGLLTVCISTGAMTREPADIRLVFVGTTHGHVAEVMENGARQAATDLSVSLAVMSADAGPGLTQAMTAAVASRPHGIAVAVESDDALLPAFLDVARASGIPVVGVAPIDDAATSPGLLLRVGPNDMAAGAEAGQRLGRLGVTNALCLQVATGVPASDRCAGAVTGIAETGGSMDVLLALDPAGDPSGVRGAVAARLAADPTIDGILMTESASTSQVLAAITLAGRGSTLQLATFGLGADALDALEARQMTFALDQAPFQEGYLAILAMASYTQDRILLGHGEPLPVGYEVVTPEDAVQVRTLVQKGLR